MQLSFRGARMRNTLLLSSLLTMACKAQQAGLTPALNKRLVTASQGSVVELPGLLTEKLTTIPYTKMVLPGPQYLISDDPEYIRIPEGMAFRESVTPGSVRFYLYNVNGVKEPAKVDTKIAALLKNTSTRPLHLRMLKFSSQKPTTSYFFAGKQGLADYFAAKPDNAIRTVQPGETIALDPHQEKAIVKYDELVHGIYEFVIDEPAEISVVQTTADKDIIKAAAGLNTVLPGKSKSGAGRGVFGVSNYRVMADTIIDTRNGISQIIVADGRHDTWVKGIEGNSGAVATLAGNYGVLYNIDLKWKSSNGQGLALVTWNARSDNNQWCGAMANTMVASNGKFKEGIIQLPADKLVTRKAPEAVLVQLFTPDGSGKEQTIHLTYSPPGASCLPTPLVFIPVDLK